MAQDREKLDRQFPYLSIVFALAAVVCHCLVLAGNVQTTKAMHNLGHSFRGWAVVGQNTSQGLEGFGELMSDVGHGLTEVISKISHVQEGIDMVMSKVGDAVNTVLLPVHEAVNDFDVMSFFQVGVSVLDKLQTALSDEDGDARRTKPTAHERWVHHQGVGGHSHGITKHVDEDEREELWPDVGLDHAKCTAAGEFQVSSRYACQAEAIAADHRYYQYTSKGWCATASVCDRPISGTSWPWKVYYQKSGEGGGFQFFEFTPLRLRTPTGSGVQVAEISLKLSDGEVFPMAAAIAANHGGMSPPGEEAAKAFDNDPSTKWTDMNSQPLMVQLPQPVHVQAFSFTTAADRPDRDPVEWIVRGSPNGVVWVAMHLQCSFYNVTTERGERTEWFPLKFLGFKECATTTTVTTTTVTTLTTVTLPQTLNVNMSWLNQTVVALVDDLAVLLEELRQRLHPLLKRIEKWVLGFSPQVQSFVGDFGVTMERVQSIFDVFTQVLGKAVTSTEDMVSQTYNLFDVSNTGRVTLKDMQDVSVIYGIAALAGTKAEELFMKYDANSDEALSPEEFSNLAHDPTLPNIMQVVIRTYARRLAGIAGTLKRGWTRKEVAVSVANYVQLVVAKNATKIGWMAQALSNGSLPLNFTASVLKELAMLVEDPNSLTAADVGASITGEMVMANPNIIIKAVDLMSDPDWWMEVGFEPVLQPVVVERVTRWSVLAIHAQTRISSTSLLAALLGGRRNSEKGPPAVRLSTPAEVSLDLKTIPEVMRRRTERRARQVAGVARDCRARRAEQLLQVNVTRRLFQDLLGTSLPSVAKEDWEAARAINSGKQAAPETLEFAKWLGANASETAATLELDAFTYSPGTGQVMEAWGSKIQHMVDKVLSFIRIIQKYASPSGMQELDDLVQDFLQNATQELLDVVMHITHYGNVTSIEFGVWPRLRFWLSELQGLLPIVLDALEGGREGVNSVASRLDSTMQTLYDKGAPFDQVAYAWRAGFIAYYILWLMITVSIVFFNLWVSGFLGAESQLDQSAEYVPPSTWGDRFSICFASTSAFMKNCSLDNPMFFWSLLLLCDILILVTFYVSVTLCAIVGVATFIHAGCANIYMVADPSVCMETISSLKTWLGKMNEDAFLKESACHSHHLLTCDILRQEIEHQSFLTGFGSFFASFFSFQLLVESAILHERAHWHRLKKEILKMD